MKKILALFLAMLVVVTMAACGGPAYTRGTVADGRYENTWAGIAYTFGGSWTDTTEEQNATMAGTGTETGLCVQNDLDGRVLQMMFEKLPILQRGMTEQDYANTLKEEFETSYAELGYTIGGFSTSSATVAGESYLVLKTEITSPELVQLMYLRKIDAYMVAICVSAQSEADAQEIAAGIEKLPESK